MPTLLRALAAVPAVAALLVGDGDLRPSYERLRDDLGLGGRVAFAGRVPACDLPAVHRAADFLVLPSETRGEAFGMVLIEALASGRPVIATDLPGVRSVVAPNQDGLLVPPANPAALAAAIDHLAAMDPAERAAMGARGRHKVEQAYTWDRIGAQLDRLYRSVPRERAARRRPVRPSGPALSLWRALINVACDLVRGRVARLFGHRRDALPDRPVQGLRVGRRGCVLRRGGFHSQHRGHGADPDLQGVVADRRLGPFQVRLDRRLRRIDRRGGEAVSRRLDPAFDRHEVRVVGVDDLLRPGKTAPFAFLLGPRPRRLGLSGQFVRPPRRRLRLLPRLFRFAQHPFQIAHFGSPIAARSRSRPAQRAGSVLPMSRHRHAS
ncbi:MAG: hypothetical protein AVDCRST_MAG73-2196 [uncultured Thermomicrobiales bacterium]|uniref:Glycosyl transferase family 1 domain-containing protein n=1 Tax=uncultured Thermomicrobiales bacterium TaxID=1645740 RepID=A0A6J4UBC0_9BACT|nr:MAG: hypothetical protein AVDCRST_MAG73-2196 [uncultured Thermomicrobiales bacterium]